MSYEAMHKVRACGLTDRTLVDVLDSLAFFLNQESGLCFPSTDSIARVARLSPNIVRRAVKDLETAGYISTYQKPGGRRNFQLHLERLPDGDFSSQSAAEAKGVSHLEGVRELTGVSEVKGVSEVTPIPCKKCDPSPVRSERGPLSEVTPEQGNNKEKNKEIEQGIETHEDAASGSTSPKARAKKGEAWKKWIKVEKPAEVPDDLWKQFGEIRALKKMALTERALELLRTEGEKAHMTLLQVVETCCGNGWAGFKASWLTKAIGNAYRKPQNITQTAEYRERLQACCRGEGRTEKLADDGVTIIVD